MAVEKKIPRRFTTAILSSMRAGVVPNIGLEHIAVGRQQETDALLTDLDNIAQGGGAFRVVMGKYGSGKSFMLQLARSNALQRNYIVMHADMSPERRLAGSKGQGLRLYRELMAHFSTKARPDGNAVEAFLEKWITDLQQGIEKDGIGVEDALFNTEMDKRIGSMARILQSRMYGYDLAMVLLAYWHGVKNDDFELKQLALRWVRGEIERKTDASKLKVTQIITDANWYDFLKLLAFLAAQLNYKGLLVLVDEGVNLYKITNRISRENNYEKLLTIFNDIMQGNAEHIGFFLGSTPQAVEDPNRGLFSYEALRSRLQGSHLAREGLVDFSGPLMGLMTLKKAEVFLLLENLQKVFCAHNGISPIVTEDQMMQFLDAANARIGADKLLTPREVTRDFISLMELLYQNENETFDSIMGSNTLKFDGLDHDPDELNDAEFAQYDDV